MEVGLEMENLNEAEAGEQYTDVPNFIVNSEVREYAPNMEVQAEEIKDVFLDISELQYDEWKELTMDQKAEALNAFEQKIAEIEKREPLLVEHEVTKATTMGYFDGTKIVISDHLLSNNSYESYKEVMNTLFHEGRHAYQFYNLDVARTEANGEMVEAWRVNLQELGYEKGNNTLFSNNGFWRYYTQPIEVDARVFAETVCDKIGL